jgi:pentatricopeptide repeat protein
VPNLSYYASFTVILAGFAQNGPEDKAFELFAEMAGEGNPCTGHQEVLQKEHPCLQWFDQYVSKVCRVARVSVAELRRKLWAGQLEKKHRKFVFKHTTLLKHKCIGYRSAGTYIYIYILLV